MLRTINVSAGREKVLYPYKTYQVLRLIRFNFFFCKQQIISHNSTETHFILQRTHQNIEKMSEIDFDDGSNNEGSNMEGIGDDDDGEIKADATTTTSSHHSPIGRRDEVVEVRKMSSKDTKRLRLWRIVVTSVLLLTAFVITFTTYKLLKQQEDSNFRTGVSVTTSSNRSFPFTGHNRLTIHCRFLTMLDCSLNNSHVPSVMPQSTINNACAMRFPVLRIKYLHPHARQMRHGRCIDYPTSNYMPAIGDWRQGQRLCHISALLKRKMKKNIWNL